MGLGQQKVRVIVADDHAGVRASLHRLLDRAGDLEVVGDAANGIEVLEMVDALKPDVLLLDMEMPQVDGVEVTRTLHKQGTLVRIIILSAYEEKGYIKNVMDLGAYAYLTKDEQPGDIIQAIRLAAQGKQVARRDLYSPDYRLGYQGIGSNLG